MKKEDIVHFYKKRGFDVSRFVEIFGKKYPVVNLGIWEEPKVEYTKERYVFKHRSRVFRELEEETRKRLWANDYVAHCDSIKSGVCKVKRIDYLTRSLFVVNMDRKLPIIKKTLRELILPHPFSGHFLESIEEYPFPKSIGVHIILKKGNTYYFQKRSEDLLTYPGYIDASAGGALDFGELPRDVVKKEAHEEMNINKIRDIKYVSLYANYDLLLDVFFVYVGEIDSEPQVSEEVNEIIPIEVSDTIELIDELKHMKNRLTPNVVAFLSSLLSP